MTKVSEVMSREPVAVAEDVFVLDAVSRMAETQACAVVVCREGKPIGIFSERDLVKRVVAQGLEPAATRLADVMTGEVFVAEADSDVERVFDRMCELHIRNVPIVEQGQLVGLLSAREALSRRSAPVLDTRVVSWMTEQPYTVTAGASLQATVEEMARRRIGAAVVVDGGGMAVGILTERDLLNKVMSRSVDPRALKVGDVMTPDPTTCTVEDDFGAVYDTFVRLKARHLPIVDQGNRLVGIVSIRDVFLLKERIMDRFIDEKTAMIQRYEDLLAQAHGERMQVLLREAEKLKNQAITDELTGLYNHRYFHIRLEEEVERARRYKHPLSLVIADIDDFKRVNDTYGHPAGDEVLRDVAGLLAGWLNVTHVLVSLRRCDLVARYGGEEFVFILPETRGEDAEKVAERVRNVIANHRFLEKSQRGPIAVTASFGIASVPDDAEGKDELLRKADEALYVAKRTGKNKAVRSLRPAVP